MSMVQIRNVPDELVAELKARAAARRQTLTDYLLDQLTELAQVPPVDDVLDRLASGPRRDLGARAVDLLDEVRSA
ncbi:MAG TPA: hypothetical protein VFN21_13075 [Acidimicrobiales bacterium]|nr:hypothetical protein [Acidimicrobiales bacterium]